MSRKPTAADYLARIAARDGALGAFDAVDMGAASPLSQNGLAVAIKANIAVSGLPWTAGIAAYRDRMAKDDATCVARLRKAGATILGTTNMHEGALGATTDNPAYRRTHNPWARDFTAGGSSGGSAAAVSAGLCDVALGTDTFGSVRIPAAHTGVFGLKPVRGAIALDGVVPLSWTFDHVGILARTAGLCREVLATIGDEPVVQHGDTMRRLGEPGDIVAATLLADRMASAGIDVPAIALPAYDHAKLIRPALLIAEAEAYLVHGEAMRSCPEGFSPAFRKLLSWGANEPPARLAEAYRKIDAARERIEKALAGIDLLILPAMPHPAHRFDAPPAEDPSRFTLLASILGWPAVVFPIGFGADGLPRSAQVMARSSMAALMLAERLAMPLGPPPGFLDQAIN